MRPVLAALLVVPACSAALLGLAPLSPAHAEPAAPAPVAAPPAAPVDPAQLALARAVVLKVFPEGTYARIMNGSMAKLVEGAAGSAQQLPLRQLLQIGGIKESELARLGPATLKDIMEVFDPAYQERMSRVTTVMFAGMGEVMTTFEPEVREGLSRAYAHHFTPAQLADLHAFFATPTGATYARDSMVIFMEPEVMEVMQSVTPRLMQAMPGIMGKVQAATADLPRPREYKDLTPAQRARLDQLLGGLAKRGS